MCPGLPRSGTLSLWRMLSEAKIINCPHKEPHFLTVMSDDKTDCPSFYPPEFKKRYHDYVYGLNQDILNISPPYSIEMYKKYITQYKFDFSQSYWFVSEEYLKKIKNLLSEFEIKIILLYRDPVARLFSFCNLVCAHWDLKKTPLELFHYFLDMDDCKFLYPRLYSKYKNVFGNVICLKTEKFFNTPTEYDRLLKFLGKENFKLDFIFANRTHYSSHLNRKDTIIGRDKLKSSYEFYSKL